MFGIALSLGAGLLTVAFFAQWLIKKRVQNKGLQQPLQWIAWTFAAVGGTALNYNWADTAGVTSLGAAVVSMLGGLLLWVDFRDKRPDWLGFFVIAVMPGFMRATGGVVGQIFDAVLFVPDFITRAFGALFGV